MSSGMFKNVPYKQFVYKVYKSYIFNRTKKM